jgi:hypothetical protein
MSRRRKADPNNPVEPLVRGATLEPIRVVKREITLPDGTTTVVDVPVYPPFRLEERPAPPPKPAKRALHKAKPKVRRAKASGEKA